MRLSRCGFAVFVSMCVWTQCVSAQDTKLIEVNVGYVPSVDQVAGIVGINNGIFEKYGIDIHSSKPFATGVDILNAMQSGFVDIGTVGAPLMGAALSGMDVVVVGLYAGSAVQARADESYALIARKGAGIDPKNLETLKGKKVGVTVGSTNQLYAFNMLRAHGIAPDSVTFINTAPADMAVALQTAGVDAIAAWEPWPTVAKQAVEGTYEVTRGGHYVANIGFVVARGEFARKNPEAIVRFMQARSEASQWVRTHVDEASEVVALAYPSLKDEAVKQAMRYTAPTLDARVSACTYLAMQEQLDFILLTRKMQAPSGFDIGQKIDTKIMLGVQKAKPELFSDLPAIPAAVSLGEGGERREGPEVRKECGLP